MYEAEQVTGTPVGGARRCYNPVQRDYATFLETSEETDNQRTLIEVEVAPGGGTTPHYHLAYEESFEVLEGALDVMVDDETQTLRPGKKATARKNTLHCFRNATDQPARFLVELRLGSSGFEKALRAGYGLARDGRTFSDGTPKNPYHLAVLLEWSEMRLPGVLTLVEPLLRLLARLAHRRGIDKELQDTYCE